MVRSDADARVQVSPADGRVLHFGEINGERVEQVKGMTYSLNALLGVSGSSVNQPDQLEFVNQQGKTVDGECPQGLGLAILSGTDDTTNPRQTKNSPKSTTSPTPSRPSSAPRPSRFRSRNNPNKATPTPALPRTRGRLRTSRSSRTRPRGRRMMRR